MEQTTNTTPTTPIAPNPIKTAPEAPKTHKTKNQPLIIGLIICAILALAGIGFGAYGIIASNHYSSEVDDLKSMVADKDEIIADLQSPDKNPSTPENPDDDQQPDQPQTSPYTTFADNLAKSSFPSVFGYYYHDIENPNNMVIANIDQNHHLAITDINNNNQVIAEADNVISVYYMRIGNGGVPYFYMIHQDGTVSRIDISEISDHHIENLNDYTNIVSIIAGSDLCAYLIDINGNIYKAAY